MKLYEWTLLLVFSHSVVSDSLWPHGLQHARLSSPSLSPRICSISWPLSQWCHPTISSSVAPFTSCSQSFPASGSFPMSQFFALSSQSFGASDSASVPPINIQGWFKIDWVDLLAVQGTLKSPLQHHSSKSTNSVALGLLYSPTLTSIQDYWKNHSFNYMNELNGLSGMDLNLAKYRAPNASLTKESSHHIFFASFLSL